MLRWAGLGWVGLFINPGQPIGRPGEGSGKEFDVLGIQIGQADLG